MAASLLRITAPFAPRPVVYRTTDFRSNEFGGLVGGDEFEPVESNPMIGYRGCYWYVREPDLVRLELEILARVRDETPNLHLMLPLVRTRWELEACLELVDASPLGSQRGMHRWVMAEVPSVAYRILEHAALAGRRPPRPRRGRRSRPRAGRARPTSATGPADPPAPTSTPRSWRYRIRVRRAAIDTAQLHSAPGCAPDR